MPQSSDELTYFSNIEASMALPNAINKRKSPFRKHLEYAIPTISKAKKGFTFGCDPEGFLFDKTTGLPVPAAGIIPGTKWAPHKVKDGAVQVDGLAVEFNITPVSTYEAWEHNITSVISQLEAMLPENLEIRWAASVEFPAEAFDKAPDENKALGCQPDFNAWDGGVNPPPNPKNPYLRCAGGHVHIGWSSGEDMSDLQHLTNCQDLGKQFDWFLAGWALKHDQDVIRRTLYGKMGAIRYKDYGVEYRVLSNFWVATKELRLEIWNRMVSAIEQVNGLFMPDRTVGQMQEWLKTAINDNIINHQLLHFGEYPLRTLNTKCYRL